MCIRDSLGADEGDVRVRPDRHPAAFEDPLEPDDEARRRERRALPGACLLYTSDAADERSSVDLGGRRIIKKKKK